MNDERKAQRVLVVDDNPKVIRFIEIYLKLSGFEVMSANSGEEALRLAKTAEPDIMLLDIIMPGMGGLEALKELRSFSNLPVIAISATPENKHSAMLLGANDFMSKPFAPDVMVRRIQTLCPNKAC